MYSVSVSLIIFSRAVLRTHEHNKYKVVHEIFSQNLFPFLKSHEQKTTTKHNRFIAKCLVSTFPCARYYYTAKNQPLRCLLFFTSLIFFSCISRRFTHSVPKKSYEFSNVQRTINVEAKEKKSSAKICSFAFI